MVRYCTHQIMSNQAESGTYHYCQYMSVLVLLIDERGGRIECTHQSAQENGRIYMFNKTSNLSVAVANRACAVKLRSTPLNLDTCAAPSVSNTREHWKLFVGRSEVQLRAMGIIYSANVATMYY